MAGPGARRAPGVTRGPWGRLGSLGVGARRAPGALGIARGRLESLGVAWGGFGVVKPGLGGIGAFICV